MRQSAARPTAPERSGGWPASGSGWEVTDANEGHNQQPCHRKVV